MLVSICILLLAKLEKTPWLLKAANIHSPQEGLSSLFILANRNILFMFILMDQFNPNWPVGSTKLLWLLWLL